LLDELFKSNLNYLSDYEEPSSKEDYLAAAFVVGSPTISQKRRLCKSQKVRFLVKTIKTKKKFKLIFKNFHSF
jgi:hypothetical protein